MCLIFTALIAGILTQTTITVGFIIVGICCAYQILAIYKASMCVDEHLAGLTTAVANMVIMSFGYAFHSIIGLVVHEYSNTSMTHAFNMGISIIPITLAMGTVGFAYLAYRES
jgi:hypothetical protein